MALLSRSMWKVFADDALEKRMREYAPMLIGRLLDQTDARARRAAKCGRLKSSMLLDEYEALLYIHEKLFGRFNFPHQEHQASLAKALGDTQREIDALRMHFKVCRRLLRLCSDQPDLVDTAIHMFDKQIGRLKQLDRDIAAKERALLRRTKRELGLPMEHA